MSAPRELTKSEINKSIREKKALLSRQKIVLSSPYNNSWPSITSSCRNEILTRLKETVTKLELARPQRLFIKDRNKRQSCKSQQPEESAQQKQLRSQLVLGLNSVTRHLEKGQLRLLLVTQDNEVTSSLTEHLVQLSRVAQCPAAALTDMKKEISPVLNVPRVAALGFKKIASDDNHAFDDLVASISRIIPPIIDWLDIPTPKKNDVQIASVEHPSDKTDDLVNVDGNSLLLDHANCDRRVDMNNHSTENADSVIKSTNEKSVIEMSEISSPDVDYSHLLIRVDECRCAIHDPSDEFISLRSDKQVSIVENDFTKMSSGDDAGEIATQKRTRRYFLDVNIKRIKPNPKRKGKKK